MQKTGITKDDNSIVSHKVSQAKKAGIKKGAITTLVICLIIGITTGVILYSSYRTELNAHLIKISEERNTFLDQLDSRDSTINDWLMAFEQIENDLNAIKNKGNIMTIKASQEEFSIDRRAQVLNDIKYINTVLDSNKEKISVLNSKLKNSSGSVKALSTKIARLEKSVIQYEDEIAEFKRELVKKDFEIGELNTRMTAQEFTIKVQGERISEQEQQLNQAYLISGTLKVLKNKGIVSQEGGIMGIGKKKILSKVIPENEFQKIDITTTKSIPVNSKDANLITYHPKNSYRMIKGSDKMIASIEIQDPDQFWKVSRYAVVQVIK
jgi:predicted  nucleic acid-binding Zn-ribbon protein